MDRAADRIERFLADHPDGDLLICVGYASSAGVAWLSRRRRGRTVRLLIGDTREKYGWEPVAQADRDDCMEFLRSDSVEVRSWYRTDKSTHGPASAHLKAWIVHRSSRPVAALNGSANLSRNGLERNVEAMTEAHGRDLTELWEKANRVWGPARKCGDQLTGYIEAPRSDRWHRQPSHSLSPSGSRRFPVLGVAWWVLLLAVVLSPHSPATDVLFLAVLALGIVLAIRWVLRGEPDSLRRRIVRAYARPRSRGTRRRRTAPSPSRSPRPPNPSARIGRALFGVAAAVGLLLIVVIGRSFLDDDDSSVAPSPPTAPVAPVSTVEPAEPEMHAPLASAEDSPSEAVGVKPTLADPAAAEAAAKAVAVEATQQHAEAAAGAAARAAQVEGRVQPLPDGIVSVKERKGHALGRVMVAEDCAKKAAANVGAASSARDAATASEIAEQAAAHRECAEDAADAAQEWAQDAELWLAAECINDYYNHGSHLAVNWGPGWELGCEAHIPAMVPCVYLNPSNPSYLQPGYLGAAGECRANTAILSKPEGWHECLPDDGTRWRGDWTADPINGRDLCP